MATKETKERTQKLIEHFRGKPGEWDMLKGVLCVDHVFEYDSEVQKNWDATIDKMMIAARMDAIDGAK